MELKDMLFLAAAHLHLDPNELIGASQEDTIGGYHSDTTQAKWPMGSVWEVEGRMLYALVRVLKPQRVAEIGSHLGCSATHLQAALNANGAGKMTSVDINHMRQTPPEVENVSADGAAWLSEQPDESIDFLFEDASHGTDLVHQIAELAKRKLKPGGVLVNHDAAHFLVGADIRKGLDMAEIEYRVYAIEPSDCGLSIWQKPGAPDEDTHPAEAVIEPEPEAVEEAPKPKKKTPQRRTIKQ